MHALRVTLTLIVLCGLYLALAITCHYMTFGLPHCISSLFAPFGAWPLYVNMEGHRALANTDQD